MDIDIPEAAAAQPRATLEAELASVFEALLKDENSAQEVVSNIYFSCLGRVEALRAEAANQLHRPARHMALKALAEEMEAQAATWQLLFCLYCDPNPPAGLGGSSVIGVEDRALYRQRLADRVEKEPELARCARVVAWLESLARDALKRQGMVAFAPGEGLWHETKTEMRTRAGAMVSELDPDAPGRTGKPLHPSNARSQERILARVWQWMRGGNLVEGGDLCRQVGQPWRAAALGGGGLYGAVPVGIVAEEYDAGTSSNVQALQAEELADEVANGSGTLLALWRWAAQQAAAAPPGDKFERAVFGALGGSTAAAAPACSSWVDFAWVYCRSWLETQTLRLVPRQPQSAGDLVAGDAVTAALVRCGVAPAAAQRSVEGAMSVVMGSAAGAGASTAAPAAAALLDGDTGPSSRGFGQFFAQHVMSPAALVNSGPVAVQALRQLQGLLVQGDIYELASHLFATLVDRHSGDGAAANAFGDADGSAADVGGGLVAASANPERSRRTCVLAAHMLLALEGLGALIRKLDVDPNFLEAQTTFDLAQRLLGFYTGMLLEQDQLSLVPLYLCVLQQGLRSSMCKELLELHTRRLTGVDTVPSDGSDQVLDSLARADRECYEALVALDYWFRRCVERQQKPLEERSSFLETDIRKDELRVQLATFTFASRHNREYGPHQRARVARWLALPHIIAAEAVAEEAAELGAEVGDEADGATDAAAMTAAAAARLDPWSYYDVLEFANCLCCEFSLGDNVTAAAGHRLFDEVLPEGDGPVYLFDQDSNGQQQQEQEGMGMYGSDPGVIEARRDLAAQLRDRAAEVAQWRLYYHLDAKLAAWSARHEEYEQAQATAVRRHDEAQEVDEDAELAGAAEELLQEGVELLHDFLMHLLQTGWQQELSTFEKALALSAASAADGLMLMRVTLTVTCPPGSVSAPVGSRGENEWGQPTAPYPELQGAALLEFRQALDSGLRRAAAERQVEVEVAEETGPQGHGHVKLSLAVPAEARQWDALVGLVCGVVRGDLDGVPPLLLVSLEADRATSLAVCRRCCLGQVVMRCAGLRVSLVGLGADAESPQAGSQLVLLLGVPDEASGMGMESGLLELLSPSQLANVLAVESVTQVLHMRNLERYRQREEEMLR
ncbi:hypothetical protein VOLCADRAFT_96758 [Volvox carteri f. nagariensis]|uniref:Nuclear pore complex protein n=1 Tax=Volvox carteri f. nagariensis TaxID=3068 RepID=D8UAZ1_VOLCA|nr:uncharacterized protein VOLCADRAFT_96758 [Volvox carteri f. nagariensis]EFJ43078.1 hypothetical protein VOLCADRAFT_96758 [Volvox carteri f. nagariensis]|eukprot:XP_002955877.1 hypothetical protein VOLCADRAFT_96758 [Volvox carteri f. nagariensis]